MATVEQIVDVLKHERRWYSADALSRLVGVPQRQLRRIIHDMRTAGDPDISCIASNCQWGYAWIEDEEELDSLCQAVEKHARRQLAAMSGLRRAARRAGERKRQARLRLEPIEQGRLVGI